MRTLTIAIVLGAGQPAPHVAPTPLRLARAQPCGQRFVPMRIAMPSPARVALPRPAPRRDAPRRAPCFRLATA